MRHTYEQIEFVMAGYSWTLCGFNNSSGSMQPQDCRDISVAQANVPDASDAKSAYNFSKL